MIPKMVFVCPPTAELKLRLVEIGDVPVKKQSNFRIGSCPSLGAGPAIIGVFLEM